MARWLRRRWSRPPLSDKATKLVALLMGMLLAAPAAGGEMRTVAGGGFLPQYSASKAPVMVSAFALAGHAVTNGEFLGFLKQQPQWRRDRIVPLFADEAYLSHWADANHPGDLAPMDAPVTNVSWFAARAYCAFKGWRLPTMNEWEWAASAGEDAPAPPDVGAFNRKILNWYAKPTRLPLDPVGSVARNYWGLWDMHGLIWEWVEDFNALMLTGESRQDAGGLDRQLFCAAGSIGSADPSDYAAYMRYAMRSSVKARYAMQNMGFRCARDIDTPKMETP